MKAASSLPPILVLLVMLANALVRSSSSAFLLSPARAPAFRYQQQQQQPPSIATATATTSKTCLSSSSSADVNGLQAFGLGVAQKMLNVALNSPLWKLVLVPQARANIQKTAEANGIPWQRCKAWISSHVNSTSSATTLASNVEYPPYYNKSFHAYDQGNLCWDAAWEAEIASCAVGARNFPVHGARGEERFRQAFDDALVKGGAAVPQGAKILDFGCGTGASTRRLALRHPQASKIVGVDLSPYFITVGKRLLELSPDAVADGNNGNNGNWVINIENDDRIEYVQHDAATFDNNGELFDIVNVQFLLHELPHYAAKEVLSNALRVLKPGGQLWVCEMDFQAPAYAAQRANPLLFALIRSTEPYLDEYADSIPGVLRFLEENCESTNLMAATGRHFASVSAKMVDGDVTRNNSHSNKFNDCRFNADGTYALDDTHLNVWESSRQEVGE
mmetsp:Transcript_17908/g.50808  ORF Transcript_17908/g.50808 Transcript_17908/m.50808 type:complete len:448 (-) Transcript_17908:50-1393(-)